MSRGEELPLSATCSARPTSCQRVRENSLALELEVDGIDVEPRRNRGGAPNVGIERKDQRHGERLRQRERDELRSVGRAGRDHDELLARLSSGTSSVRRTPIWPRSADQSTAPVPESIA